MIARARLVGGSVAATVAAPFGLASASFFGYAPVWGFAVLAVVAAGLAGLLLGPAVARARRYGWLALAVATYICGVLFFPIATLVVGGLSLGPGMSPAPIGRGVDVLLPAYLFTPIGVLFAAPFAPGVLIGGAIAGFAVKRLAPLPEISDAEQARLSRAAGGTVGCLVLLAILGYALLVYVGSQVGV